MTWRSDFGAVCAAVCLLGLLVAEGGAKGRLCGGGLCGEALAGRDESALWGEALCGRALWGERGGRVTGSCGAVADFDGSIGSSLTAVICTNQGMLCEGR